MPGPGHDLEGRAPPRRTNTPTRLDSPSPLNRLDRVEAGPGSPLAPGLARMDSGMSGKSQALPSSRRRCLSAAAIIAYLCSGLLIVVINKSIVRDHGLHAPALVSSTGSLFTAALTRALVFFGKVHVRPVGKKPWEFAFRRALPVGLLAAGSLCFGNMSYIYLDAGFVQMLKAGTPALLLLVLSCLRVEAVSTWSAGLALIMVTGSSLATAHQPHATAIGLAVQLTSQLCEVLQCTAVQVFLQQLGFEAWDAGYYLAPAVAACCLVPSMVLEWPHIIASGKVGVLFDQMPLLIASGLVGIVVNFSSLLVIKFTSSLLAKLLVIARSSALVLFFILMGEAFTWIQVIGYVITLSAFGAYSFCKAREMEAAIREEEAVELEAQTPVASRGEETPGEAGRESDEDLLGQQASKEGGGASWDLTSFMFWFAVCVVVAGAYQMAVVGDLNLRSGSCALIGRQLGPGQHRFASSSGVPPSPYLEPITAGTRHYGDLGNGGSGSHTAGALSVQSAAKVLYLADGRFLLHDHDSLSLLERRPDSALLSSSWLIVSEQFGSVRLQALDKKGGVRWLACDLDLTPDESRGCLLWMAAASWDRWSSSSMIGQYLLRRHIDDGLYVAAGESKLRWSQDPTHIHVAEWVPEACPLRGMTPSPHSYMDAKNEVTFTMTTFFHVYARSIMFRQALSSVFMHLKERDFYVREFLVINDWYDDKSLDFNGTFTGPNVHEMRREMLGFFPGCHGGSVKDAQQRPSGQKCTFVFKDASEKGQPKALNILLDLMVTKFWIQFEDDHVFYQDVYLSRLLAPMYEHPGSCWNYARRQELMRQRGSHHPLGEPLPNLALPVNAAATATPSIIGENVTEAEGRRRRLFAGAASLAEPLCTVIGSVGLAGGPEFHGSIGSEDSFRVEDYRAPRLLWDRAYVRELLAHGGFDDDKDHGWGAFDSVGAVDWPLFSLRPALHNLTYIKSLEAPLFYGGRPGRLSEEPNITRWRDGKRIYEFHWDTELELAIRWARGGATKATVSPGACMRDVSNGISSFERSFDYR
mmetsp:Transcript_67421/g.144188  ORF Transcript_67421/g.144188 Transcript_67421/m.144188 type:complete len:1038 (-) Transcript_67421:37-3150(-)